MSRLRPPLADVVPAAAIALLGVAEVAATDPSWRGFAAAVVVPAPLAWRRRLPAGAALLVLGLAAVDVASGGQELDYLSFVLAILFALYSVGAHAELQTGLVALAGCGALASWSVQADGGSASDYAFAAIVVLAPYLVGRVAGGRAAAARDAHLRAERAVAEERARIARELHDVLAHAVGVMVVQAGAAEQILETDPGAAREALANIRRTGKESLADLRRMLGLLRAGDDSAETEPQPGIGDIDALAERVRSAGLPVELAVEGAPRPVPAGVGLTMYRVAQEALTNVLKHGNGGAARLTLAYGRDALELCVTNGGDPVQDPHGAGHGLVGMRERVSLYGGELEAAPLAEGGFRVRARVPLP